MAGPRRRTKEQRTVDTRGTARRVGANQPFQGGISQGSVMAPQAPGQGPGQRPGQPPAKGGQPPMPCPPGLEPGVNPDTGAQICKPAQANIAGNVPVNNADRAMTPKPGMKPKGY